MGQAYDCLKTGFEAMAYDWQRLSVWLKLRFNGRVDLHEHKRPLGPDVVDKAVNRVEVLGEDGRLGGA